MGYKCRIFMVSCLLVYYYFRFSSLLSRCALLWQRLAVMTAGSYRPVTHSGKIFALILYGWDLYIVSSSRFAVAFNSIMDDLNSGAIHFIQMRHYFIYAWGTKGTKGGTAELRGGFWNLCLAYIHAVYISMYWLAHALNPEASKFCFSLPLSILLPLSIICWMLIFQFSPRLVMNMSRQIINI